MASMQQDTPGVLRQELRATAADGVWSTLATVSAHIRLLMLMPLLVGVMALGITFLFPKTFTARMSFIPPQQQQSAAATALASLGALASIAGGSVGSVRTPADQYVALLQSTRIADRMIDKFDLVKAYGSDFRTDARRELSENVRVALGRRDGLITIEVDDASPERAAAMANRFVDELRTLVGQLALTEAQQRRVFFEAQLKETRDRLAAAQATLQASGFNAAALRSEPRAAAEAYAKLKAELTANEVRLQGVLRTFSESAPEVQRQRGQVESLRAQLARLEAAESPSNSSDYVGKYREYKYQEMLFELFSRQYESARLDESKEGTLIQVIDEASVPERKSGPKRGLIAVATTVATFTLLVVFLLLRQVWREANPAVRSVAS